MSVLEEYDLVVLGSGAPCGEEEAGQVRYWNMGKQESRLT